MINSTTLWEYALPCLVALLVLGTVLSTVNAEPPGIHRAPRGYVPAAPRATLPLDPSPVEVLRADTSQFDTAMTEAVKHIGATLETNREDYVAPADPLGVLDTSPDSVEAWLARWAEGYRAERQRAANANPWKVFERLHEPSHAELVMETEAALMHVQEVCEDIARRLTSAAEAAIFDWRINTDTGQLPVIDGPMAERLAQAMLES